MQEPFDAELLRQYAEQDSEAAFAALVTRHVNLVYSAAVRKTHNPHAAEEITQAVFIILARKARALRRETVLPGWLYQTARLTAANFLRNEIRRVRREQESYMQSLSNETEAWPQIEPLLDDAMGGLNEKERNAVVLRFFEGKSFQEIGAAFGGSENAAKKRVIRGLEKLRKFFAKRGVDSTAATIAEQISAHSVEAAPVALAKSVTAVAIAKGAAATISTLTLAKGTMKMMTWMKIKFGVIATFGLIATTAIIVTVLNRHGHEDSHSRAASLIEIQQLFALATAARPQRCEFEADIELSTLPYTKAQMEKELADVKNFMSDVNARMKPQAYADWVIAQSNAIVKAHSGKRIQHVREWYSGNYYRMDMNDEAAGTENFMRTHPNEYRDTLVNIPNSPFSPYAQYQVNRELRDIQLFKKETFGQPNQLWQAFQMDQQAATMFVISLMDSSDVKKNLSPHALDFSKMKMDPSKTQLLHDQTDSIWRLEAFDEKLNGKNVTRFNLKGNLAALGPVQADVWTGQILGKTVCLQESVTNLPPHISVFSKQEKFGDDGSPTVWTVSTVNADSTFETKKVVFKRIDLNSTFTDEEVFAPVFPPNYIVSDLSSGRSVILQNPSPEMWLKNSPVK